MWSSDFYVEITWYSLYTFLLLKVWSLTLSLCIVLKKFIYVEVKTHTLSLMFMCFLTSPQISKDTVQGHFNLILCSFLSFLHGQYFFIFILDLVFNVLLLYCMMS